MHLTIAYFTSRIEPRLYWFKDSLDRETRGNYDGIKVIVVDFWATSRDEIFRSQLPPGAIHVPPKPCVWQGPHRLTKEDYFAASNARNTAICLAPDGYIAFVDDLSVLLPGWLAAVRRAIAGGYIALGAYKKMRNLVVRNGDVESYEEFAGGVDSRWNKGDDMKPVSVGGAWMFGCSLAAPVEAFLQIEGFSELADSIGGEDYSAGMMLERIGHKMYYDRSLLTYESEEDHAQLPVFRREDPCRGDPNAKPRDDMSHAMLKVLSGFSHPGYWEPGGIRALRKSILAGGEFPIPRHPEHRWFDGVPLRDLPLSSP